MTPAKAWLTDRLALATIVLVALVLQLFLIQATPYPYVIDNGDNGSILYIIARWLNPAAFAGDVLLGSSDSTGFYQAALMWPNYLLGLAGFELGLFFVIICFPMVLAHMLGFYILGQRLFRHQGAALALSLITLPTVFTLSGDLWGMNSSPLMRTAYGAALPWLLVILLGRPRPYLLMVLAGLASYLHLPSGPPVALALLAVSFLRAKSLGQSNAFVHHFLAGLLFLLVVLPYLILYTQGFAAGDKAALDVYQTSPYGNLGIAFDQLWSLRGPERMATLVGRVPGLQWMEAMTKPVFGTVYAIGLATLLALVIAPIFARLQAVDRDWIWISAFFVVTAAISFGLTAIDQSIAAALQRGPVQLDLIRATRFLVPGAFLGVFFALWLMFRHRKIGTALMSLLTMFVWLAAYPSTSQGLYRLTQGAEVRSATISDFGQFVLDLKQRRDLDPLVPIVSHDFLASALRYIGYLPLRFNRKDNNFITYSGVGDAAEHLSFVTRIDAILAARRDPKVQAPLIDAFVRDLKGRDMVIDRRIVSEPSESQLLDKLGFQMIYERGEFALLRRRSSE